MRKISNKEHAFDFIATGGRKLKAKFHLITLSDKITEEQAKQAVHLALGRSLIEKKENENG